MVRYASLAEAKAGCAAHIPECTGVVDDIEHEWIANDGTKARQEIESNFDNMGAIITSSVSKNGKYTSVSIHVEMTNPEAVIEKYMLIGKEVKDVISL